MPVVEPSLDTALGEFFERHADDVYRYLRVRLPAADAEEVTQDVFVVAWRKPADIPDNAIAWLLGVARKLAANRRRLIEHAAHLSDDARSEVALSFPDHADAVGEADIAARALGRLSAPDRDVIQLLIVRDMTNQELALALGCTPGAAAVRVHRARARLREAFEAEDRAERDLERIRNGERA